MVRVPEKNENGKRRYGAWVGNPKGRAENENQCAAEIPMPHSWTYTQCSRKRGHGPGGEFCKQHASKLDK